MCTFALYALHPTGPPGVIWATSLLALPHLESPTFAICSIRPRIKQVMAVVPLSESSMGAGHQIAGHLHAQAEMHGHGMAGRAAEEVPLRISEDKALH